MRNIMDAQIHLTSECNFKCKHCYNQQEKVELDINQFNYIFNQLLSYMKENRCKPNKMIFCGGEPTLSPILLSCIKKAKQAGFIRISLLTNGSLLNNHYLISLVNAGCTDVQICIEGNEETHETIRGNKLTDVIKYWKLCRSVGLNVLNQTSINILNYQQINEIIDICKNRVNRVTFLKEVHYSNYYAPLNAENWLSVLRNLFLRYIKEGENLRTFVHIKDLHWSRLFYTEDYICGINSKIKLPIVEANGDVYVCRRGDIKIGNIFDVPLKEIYFNSTLLKKLFQRSNLKGKCRSCALITNCGGCRGNAKAINGNIFSEDLHCPSSILSKISSKTNKMDDFSHHEAEYIREYFCLTGCRDFEIARKNINLKYLASMKAKNQGFSVSSNELQNASDIFRMDRKLYKAKDAKKWFEANGISISNYKRVLEYMILARKVK